MEVLPLVIGNLTSFMMNTTTSHHRSHEPGNHHHHYRISPHFEMAVEYINSFAGLIILMGVVLSILNLIVVFVNAAAGRFHGMNFLFFSC
jgi:hypothetical protein